MKVFKVLIKSVLIAFVFLNLTLAAADEFELTKVYPRIFTPNNDGLNDLVYFYFSNPQDSLVSCRIFDILGRETVNLHWGGERDSLVWNGRDDQGNAVSSGVYIYQIEAEGKTLNGVIIVAR
ncbi:MAG: gliding motility-associated C-terminal domain-containing protein [Elusimicrobiota bacterium]